VAEACAVRGWDGYGAAPISSVALEIAQEFCDRLPADWPSPEVAADPEGDVCLEWARGPRWVFTITVSEAGQFSYAGLFESNRVQGVETSSHLALEAVRGSLERLFRSSASGGK
jgi:hypothetical protein